MWWFSGFMCQLFEYLINNPEKSMAECATLAYQEKLGPNHPWLIRKIASSAMGQAGTRE